jgi:hypothetical protein
MKEKRYKRNRRNHNHKSGFLIELEDPLIASWNIGWKNYEFGNGHEQACDIT